MDMIEKIELEDAIKHYRKIAARVEEVARFIGGISQELPSSPHYVFEKFILGREMIFARFERDPNDVDDDYEEVAGAWVTNTSNESYVRQVVFPIEYLFAENWRPAAEEHYAKVALELKNMKRKNLEDSIERLKTQIDQQLKAIEEL